jgi:hypothetical protein
LIGGGGSRRVRTLFQDGFSGDGSFREMIMSSDCQLNQIRGFQRCTSLRRFVIPSSVEILCEQAFCGCSLLAEIVFILDCHLESNCGFRECISLFRIEIASFVNIIAFGAFSDCRSLSEVLFGSNWVCRPHVALSN